MSNIEFSIIIPCYNYAQYLPRAVSSLTTQADENIEIIIVDDGSTDNTKVIAQELERANNKINYFWQSNKGAAAARNFGVANSSGEYLIFLDADDELLPNALQLYRNAIQQSPNSQIFIGNHVTQGKDGILRSSKSNSIDTSNHQNVFESYLKKKLSISAGAFAMHRYVFDRLKYPESLRSTEDIPLFAQSLALFDTTLIDHPLVKIYKHDDSLRHNYGYSKSIGTEIVDTLFDPAILPPEYMKFRHDYFLKRCLSLTSLAYRAGDYSASRKWYLTAVNFDRRALLKISQLKRFLLSYLRKDSFKKEV